MDVYECLKARRTVRRFAPVPVPDSTVTRILEAARYAPSSRNQQPWHLIVIRDRQTLEKIGAIADTGTFIASAPLAIAIAMNNADSPELDAGRALQQMELMAWSDGLGTCFVTLTGTEVEEIAELLRIPPGMGLITVLPFGYRPESFKGYGIRRNPLSEMAHIEQFGNSYVIG